MFESWPNWIQTLAAVCIVGLTGWTLKVLREYARDTNSLARDSASQTERGQMPFLAIAMREVQGYVMENQGFGPALNILYSGIANNAPFTRSVASLSPGAEHGVHNEFSATFDGHLPFTIEYQSLSGQRYQTVINRGPNGQLLTEFHKL